MKVNVISLPYIFQVLFVLCFTRPRYQVSVYRTFGPLVSIRDPLSCKYVSLVSFRLSGNLALFIIVFDMYRIWAVMISPLAIIILGGIRPTPVDC